MFSKDELDSYIIIHKKLEEFAEEFNDEFGYSDYSLDSVYIEGSRLEIETSGSCRGSNDTNWFGCPIEYLWDDDWKSTEKLRLQEENFKALRKHAEKKKEEKKAADKDRYERYLELKEEFDG